MSDYGGLLAISGDRLQAERLRLEVAAQNLANAHSVVGSQGEPYRFLASDSSCQRDRCVRRTAATGKDAIAELRGVDHIDVLPTGGEPRLDYDPGNPLADSKGMVRMPQINVSDEMLTVLSSVRAYERTSGNECRQIDCSQGPRHREQPRMTYPVESIGAVASSASTPRTPGQACDASDFSNWLEKGIGSVNQNVAQADHAVQLLAVGQAESLPDVMIALDNAKMSLSLMLQVRDRLVQGYQEILRMQI